MSKKECAVPECRVTTRLRRGYCNAHYMQLRLHGHPLAGTPRGATVGSVSSYVRDYVAKYECDDCLIWPHYRDQNGYAKCGSWYVSRYVCALVNGEPPTNEYHAAHSCGRGSDGCVNPRHLRWATKLENEHDKFVHGTTVAGERNSNAKLTYRQVQEIRSLASAASQYAIARRYGVSQSTVGNILRGKTWRANPRDARHG